MHDLRQRCFMSRYILVYVTHEHFPATQMEVWYWGGGADNLPPSCADCFEIWEPRPPGILRACPGNALLFFISTTVAFLLGITP
jgi:hypothetical protein